MAKLGQIQTKCSFCRDERHTARKLLRPINDTQDTYSNGQKGWWFWIGNWATEMRGTILRIQRVHVCDEIENNCSPRTVDSSKCFLFGNEVSSTEFQNSWLSYFGNFGNLETELIWKQDYQLWNMTMLLEPLIEWGQRAAAGGKP